jgi:hypothetical protein
MDKLAAEIVAGQGILSRPISTAAKR